MKKNFLVNIFLMTIMMCVLFAINVIAAPTSGNLTYTSGQAISISVVNQNPDPAASGDTVEVKLGVQNYGSDSISNMVVEFVPSYPFEAVVGEPTIQTIGTVGGYQSGSDAQIVTFNVRVNKDATAGTYDLTFKYYTKGNEDNSVTKTVSVTVNTRSSAEIIHIDKTVLIPGKQTNLTFTIHNVGSAPLRDLTFYWVNSDEIILPVGSDNTQYIKYLDVGDSVDMNYQVIADTSASAGLYTLNLYLSYTDPLTNTAKTISTIAGVYVGGGTDFDVAFSDSTTGTTSFTIANTGSNPASSVSVVIPDQSNWRVSGTNSMIIGNLNKGDYTVASFKLTRGQIGTLNVVSTSTNNNGVSPDAARNVTNARNFTGRLGNQSVNSLTLQIVYTDTLGERTTVEKTVQILSSSNSTSTGVYGGTGAPGFNRTSTKQGFFTKNKWYIIAIILIVGGFIFWQYRKKKLLNKDVKLKDIFKNKKK